MTDVVQDGASTPPVIASADADVYAELWEEFWADFEAREANKSHGPLPVLDVDKLGASLARSRPAAFETQGCAELVDPAFRADPTLAAYAATKPFLTTREASACTAASRPQARCARPSSKAASPRRGRRGGTGTLMWSREGSSTATSRVQRLLPSVLDVRGTHPEATGGTHDETSVGSEVDQLGGGATISARCLSAKRREGFSFEGERSIRVNGATRQGLSEACRT